MTAFRYQAVEGNGAPVQGTIEADDRKAALALLGERGLFPSSLETSSSSVPPAAFPLNETATGPPAAEATYGQGRWNLRQLLQSGSAPTEDRSRSGSSKAGLGQRIKRKEITAFTREMSALLGSGISIPQALGDWVKRRKIQRSKRQC